MDDSAPIETTSEGGRQSKLLHMFVLLAPHAQEALTSILRKGGIKYEYENWRKISVEDHVNHAMYHINNWLKWRVAIRTMGPNEIVARPAEDELAHAYCRLMFAVELETIQYGPHDEHSLTAHEQIERKYLRDLRPNKSGVSGTKEVDRGERPSISLSGAVRRHLAERPSPAYGSDGP